MGIRVLFIYPNTFGMNMLPPAIALLSAILKQNDHKVALFDATYYSIDYGLDSDGFDYDQDGLCDIGDADDDNDGALDGVDSVFLGPGDLSSVLGVHGEVTHEKVRSTMEQMIPKIIEAGKHPGTLVADADQAKYWNDKGINFLIGSANRYLMNGAKEFIETTQKILRS